MAVVVREGFGRAVVVREGFGMAVVVREDFVRQWWSGRACHCEKMERKYHLVKRFFLIR